MNKKPCKECPFRRNSVPGWLGDLSGQPEVFVDAIDNTIIPCHMRVEWDEEMEENLVIDGEQNPCIGALSFCKNSVKFPRAARQKGTAYYNLIKQAVENPDVFQWRNEFVKHHTY
jgi:hypothetical protein